MFACSILVHSRLQINLKCPMSGQLNGQITNVILSQIHRGGHCHMWGVCPNGAVIHCISTSIQHLWAHILRISQTQHNWCLFDIFTTWYWLSEALNFVFTPPFVLTTCWAFLCHWKIKISHRIFSFDLQNKCYFNHTVINNINKIFQQSC